MKPGEIAIGASCWRCCCAPAVLLLLQCGAVGFFASSYYSVTTRSARSGGAKINPALRSHLGTFIHDYPHPGSETKLCASRWPWLFSTPSPRTRMSDCARCRLWWQHRHGSRATSFHADGRGKAASLTQHLPTVPFHSRTRHVTRGCTHTCVFCSWCRCCSSGHQSARLLCRKCV